jgi:hypothetical protein
MRNPWSKVLAWLALLVVAGCAGLFAYLAISRSFDKDGGPWVQVLVVVLGLGAAIAHFVATSPQTGRRGLLGLLEPRRIAVLFGAVIAGFGAVVLGLTLFDPPGAVEDRPRQIQEDAAAARKAAEEAASRLAPKPWRAFEEIDGLWGEAQYGCRVVYRFERQDKALTVTLVRKDPGMSDYRMTASLAQTGEGDRLDAVLRTSTAPDETDGQALVFTYFSDGAVKRLGWLNETRSRAETRLEWCGVA